jgi:SH3-like domain-containing protein
MKPARLVSAVLIAFFSLAVPAAGFPPILRDMLPVAGTDAVAQTSIDNPSGLPVPRFVSLRSDEVNLRTGPGLTYPIDWVYKRKELPVEVIDEFDTWRQIRDFEGTEGWVHQSMIDGKRTFMILGEQRVITLIPEEHAKSAARLQPGVIGEIQECLESGWCLVSAKGYRGWIKRELLWGTLEGEVFE